MNELRLTSAFSWSLALAALTTTLAGCVTDSEPDESDGERGQGISTCSYPVTANTYVGSPQYWGTLTFKNTSAVAMTGPQIAFNVPAGVHCDYDDPGWQHTQSGATCTYTRKTALSVKAGASYTFHYSTDSSSSFTATAVQISDATCAGGGSGGAGGSTGGTGGSTGGTGGSTGGSGGAGAGGSGGSGGAGGSSGMTANQKKVAEAMTSIWENDTPVLAYAYSEDIGDGRGYTSGRAGFCTGTGDAILVIQCYDNLRSAANGNLMFKYMPALIQINNAFESTGEDQGDTSALDAVGDWVTDWGLSYTTAATQADFKACQDQVSDQLYYAPAMAAAQKWGLTSALSRAALYDAFINHGEDGALAFIKKANNAIGNTGQVAPAVGWNGTTESAFLKVFLEKRRDTLANNSTWVDAIDRVAGYEKQRRRGNWSFSVDVTNDVRALDCWPGQGYPSSGYTPYALHPDGTGDKLAKPIAYSCN